MEIMLVCIIFFTFLARAEESKRFFAEHLKPTVSTMPDWLMRDKCERLEEKCEALREKIAQYQQATSPKKLMRMVYKFGVAIAPALKKTQQKTDTAQAQKTEGAWHIAQIGWIAIGAIFTCTELYEYIAAHMAASKKIELLKIRLQETEHALAILNASGEIKPPKHRAEFRQMDGQTSDQSAQEQA